MSAAQQLSHVYPRGSCLDGRGRLQLGGCDALELAAEFGTPAYVVVEDDLRARAREFVAAFAAHTDDFAVHFASKAFACTAVARVMAEEGIHCDVASGGELAMALKAGFDPSRVELHGNAKTRAELMLALEAGVGTIVVDNLDEAALLLELLDRPQRVQLRIAPGVSPDTHPSISTGGPNTKFGLNMEDAARAVELLGADPRVELEGIHFHIGSQIMELAPFRAALERVTAALGTDFPVWNLGGGLGVAYGPDEHPPSVQDYAAAKVAMVRELCGPGKTVVDEPGRALTANTCVTLYTVQSVKRNVATWVAVDGGMSDNLRPMLYGAEYEVEVADRFGGSTSCIVTGKHCESGDVLVRDALLDEPRPGDVLVTPATGAYGFSMANTYNGQPRPPVVFVSGGDARLVVRRESHEELFSRDV